MIEIPIWLEFWFPISAFVLVIDTFFWFGKLRAKDRDISFFSIGSPGVIEGVYLNMARELQINAVPFLCRRALLYVNAMLSLVAILYKQDIAELMLRI